MAVPDNEGIIAMSRDAVRDEAKLRAALEDADVTPMLLVHGQLTGDHALVDELSPYIRGPWSFQQSVPPALRAKVVDALIGALKAVASSSIAPLASAPAKLQHLMSAAAGRPVSPEYVPLLLEEMQYEGEDTRQVTWRKDVGGLPIKDFKVVVMGAGISGVCAAIYLKKMGIPFVVYERNQGIGGTWLENSYPGCGVDTPSHFYSFSFAPNPKWSRHFGKRDEILAYLEKVVDDFGIREDIRFGCEVRAAEYHEGSGRWTVRTKGADGVEIVDDCNALISAVGFFNQPSIPPIPGWRDFKGPLFHTGRWDHAVDLAGKRVAMIGTGASSMQAAPSIAPIVGHLTILQRQPHWALHNPDYNRGMSAGNLWSLEHIPYFAKWLRFQMFWASSDGFHDSLHKDPSWAQPGISLNSENHKMREDIIAHARAELDGDEALLSKTIPDYPPYGKRMLRENNWFKTLKRDNVDLETGTIEKITENAIVMTDGTTHEVDVIIMATGFSAQRMLWPIEVRGRGDLTLRDCWGDDHPVAYLGITTPNFPNLFITSGPNAFWSHGGSMIFASECQVRYILQALREMIETGVKSFEVKKDVVVEYNERLHRKSEEMVWSHPRVHSYYKNKNNKLTVLMPWKLVDYWNMTREFKNSEFIASYREAAEGG